MLSKELQEKARIELNEDPKRIPQDIEAIKEWLKKQPHINAKQDDDHILMFLRSAKFSLEETKAKIDRFYTTKTLIPDWLLNLDPELPEVKRIIDAGIILASKKPTKQGCTVIYLCLGNFDASTMSSWAYMRVAQMVTLTVLEQASAQISGIIFAADMRTMNISITKMFTPDFLNMLIKVWLESLPARITGIRYMFVPSFFEPLANLVKMALKPETRERFSVCSSDIDKVLKEVGLAIEDIPKDYGGTGETLQELTDYWKQQLLKRRERFLKDDEFIVDESKRRDRPFTLDNLLGLESSFLKLEMN